jgi:hypothetical protein
MSNRTNRTIYYPEPGWVSLQRKAGEVGLAERGRPYSVSEFIRKAVEAYEADAWTDRGGYVPQEVKANGDV